MATTGTAAAAGLPPSGMAGFMAKQAWDLASDHLKRLCLDGAAQDVIAIAEKKVAVTFHEVIVAEKDSNLGRLRQEKAAPDVIAVAEKEVAIAKKDVAVAKKEVAVALHEAALVEKASHLGRLKQESAAPDVIAMAIAEKDANLARLLVTVAEKNVDVAKLEVAVAQSELGRLRQESAAPEIIVVAEKEVAVAEKTVNVAKLEVEVAKLKVTVAQRELERLKQERAAADVINVAKKDAKVAQLEVTVADKMVAVANSKVTVVKEMKEWKEASINLQRLKQEDAAANVVAVAALKVTVAEKKVTVAKKAVAVADKDVAVAEKEIAVAIRKADAAREKAKYVRLQKHLESLTEDDEEHEDVQVAADDAKSEYDVAEMEHIKAMAMCDEAKKELGNANAELDAAKTVLAKSNDQLNGLEEQLSSLALSPALPTDTAAPSARVISWQLPKQSASSLAASGGHQLKGVGSNFDVFYGIDPTSDRCLQWLIPQSQDMFDEAQLQTIALALRDACLVTYHNECIHETPPTSNKIYLDERLTQDDHLQILVNTVHLKGFIRRCKPEKTLASLGVGDGAASEGSAPDAVIHAKTGSGGDDDDGVIIGVWEVKHDTDAVKEMWGQAQAESVNVALALHTEANLRALRAVAAAVTVTPAAAAGSVAAAGPAALAGGSTATIASDPAAPASLAAGGGVIHHIPVPFICSNGRSIVFGATVLLPCNFPCTFTISPILDLADENQRMLAAKYFLKLKAYAGQLSRAKVKLIAPANTRISLSLDHHHIKLFQKVFNRFENKKDGMTASLANMMEVFRRLYADPASRQVVAFPYCTYVELPPDAAAANTPPTSSLHQAEPPSQFTISEPFLVFDNLCSQGYRMGIPVEKERMLAWLEAVTGALAAVHKAGVVHLDMYPSNVMWKEEDGKILVKLIDWDGAHFLGERLTQTTSNRHRGSHLGRIVGNLDFDRSGDACELYDGIMALVLKFLYMEDAHHEDLLRQLSLNDKTSLDNGFKSACVEYLKSLPNR
eukprot:m.41709 g.41709  ORF g.41709 m.41709 type:complete len:1014 (-) comp12036_c0_seq2:39-3080(-)